MKMLCKYLGCYCVEHLDKHLSFVAGKVVVAAVVVEDLLVKDVDEDHNYTDYTAAQDPEYGKPWTVLETETGLAVDCMENWTQP